MKPKCQLCGKKARRECPALKSSICARCCATKRISEIDCTPECESNTFGMEAIEKFREIDNNLFDDALGPYCRKHNIVTTSEIRNLRAESIDDTDFANKAYLHFQMRMFHEKQPNGKTVFENWKDNGFDGLTHDQQLILECKSKAVPTVIEFQKYIDDYFIECIDLFDEKCGKFLLLDPAIVEAGMPRFTRVICWLEHYPVFARLETHSQVLPDACSHEFVDIMKQSAKAKPYCDAEFPEKQYMLDNFEEVSRLPVEICKRQRHEMLNSIDLKECIAVYSIGKNEEKILEIICSLPDFSENPEVAEPGELYFDWLRLGKSKAFEEETPEFLKTIDGGEHVGILGNIILKKDSLVIEAKAEQKFNFVKQMADEYFGNMIKLEKEAVRDLAKEIDIDGDDGPDYEDDIESGEENIPPEIYEQIMHKFMDEHYHTFIDNTIPKLDGLTPREASKIPEMRTQLVSLMKEHINSNEAIARSKGKKPYDLSWLLDELGLGELK